MANLMFQYPAFVTLKLLRFVSSLYLNLTNSICHSFQNDSINFLIH